MSLAPLWRLPEEALLYAEEARRWKVMAARGLGEARAVFVPVEKDGEGWRLAIARDAVVPLTPVQGGRWCALPRTEGADGCVYLCVIRYDLPSNHPDDSSVRAGGPGAAPPDEVSGEELALVLDRLARRSPARVAADVIDGPADIGDASGNAPPEAQQMPAQAGNPMSRVQGPASSTPPGELTFAFGSCQYPAGMLDRESAHASYRALASYLRQGGVRPPERLLLLGDQVYTDATYGLLDPARLDDRYRMPYEDMRDRDTGPFSVLPQQFFASATRMTPDDHEFLDNWEPSGRGLGSPRYKRGLRTFWEQQRRKSKRNTRGVHVREAEPGWRLFMTDTRTQRGFRSVETLHKSLIMSGRQTRQLEDWLAEGEPDELKIVTSAAMLLPRAREYVDDPLYLDNWQGYPASFHRLLAFLCDRELRNVVFLSGDAHLACTARVHVENVDSRKSVDFVSHHAPALYAPYPFANESRCNLLLQDRFRFTTRVDEGERSYECTVRTELIDEGHDGCGLMTARRDDRGWATSVRVLR